MELFLDTADIKEIKKLNEVLTIDGVTTNPSILAKTGEFKVYVGRDSKASLCESFRL